MADATQDAAYVNRVPVWVAGIEEDGTRSLLAVPLLHDDALVGAFVIFRRETRAFGEKQIALLQNFAAQAVIAIENTRLLNELRQRTDDLSESLEQQTATTEVLKVISTSPGELTPVFTAMLENAVRICDAQFGNLALYDGRDMRLAAMHNPPPAYEELRRREPIPPSGNRSLLGLLVESKSVVRVDDLTVEPYASMALPKLAGAKSAVGVPMLRDGDLAGAIVIYRTELRPFTDKQIELVTNFAAQAVIAIENTRLLNELRQRTDDLSEFAAAADRHRRRAQGHQPLDLRSAGGAGHAGRVGQRDSARPTGSYSAARRPAFAFPRATDFRTNTGSTCSKFAVEPGRSTLVGRTSLECRPVHIAGCPRRS